MKPVALVFVVVAFEGGPPLAACETDDARVVRVDGGANIFFNDGLQSQWHDDRTKLHQKTRPSGAKLPGAVLAVVVRRQCAARLNFKCTTQQLKSEEEGGCKQCGCSPSGAPSRLATQTHAFLFF
mmetsp:Transcript_2960/g.6760  ORF Transcript_2960/g.6760 Transcript_2960/m.6760 type:complete len:125 (-) Transcript_2960:36-410(-)